MKKLSKAVICRRVVVTPPLRDTSPQSHDLRVIYFPFFSGKGTNPLDAFALSRVAVSLAPLVILAWCKSKILRKIPHILITYTSLDNMCLLAFNLFAN